MSNIPAIRSHVINMLGAVDANALDNDELVNTITRTIATLLDAGPSRLGATTSKAPMTARDLLDLLTNSKWWPNDQIDLNVPVHVLKSWHDDEGYRNEQAWSADLLPRDENGFFVDGDMPGAVSIVIHPMEVPNTTEYANDDERLP